MSAPITYIPGWMAPDAAGHWTDIKETFGRLWNDLPWERRDGAPRRECWMNDFNAPYTYGRGAGERTYQPVQWHPFASLVQSLIKEETGHHLEGCFINGYEGPRDHLGWHADDSPEIDAARPIAILSLGTPRFIMFREIGQKNAEAEKLLIEPGSLLLMHAGMQQSHEHRIPKHAADCGTRISLTYRGLVRK